MGNNTFKNPHSNGGGSMKRLIVTAATVVLCASSTSRAQPCEWEVLTGGGVIGTTWALAVFDDGSGPGLYAGGQIAQFGGVQTPGIARWDGQFWSPVGSGTDYDVRLLHVFDDGRGPALYAGGAFHYAGGIRVMGIGRCQCTQPASAH